MAAYFKAQNEIKKQVKAEMTDWSNLEPSEEDEGYEESTKISSDEEESEGGAEEIRMEAHFELNTSAPIPAQGEQLRTEQPVDSFEEAMNASRNEAKPSHRANERTSIAGGGDQEIWFFLVLFNFCFTIGGFNRLYCLTRLEQLMKIILLFVQCFVFILSDELEINFSSISPSVYI